MTAWRELRLDLFKLDVPADKTHIFARAGRARAARVKEVSSKMDWLPPQSRRNPSSALGTVTRSLQGQSLCPGDSPEDASVLGLELDRRGETYSL